MKELDVAPKMTGVTVSGDLPKFQELLKQTAEGIYGASHGEKIAEGSPGLIEADDIRVGSRVGGRVREVQVAEGQRVAAGDVLVTLEPFDLLERLAQSQAELAARRTALQRLEAGYRIEEIAQARARRDRWQAVVDRLVAGARPLEIRMREDALEVARAELVHAESEHQRIQRLRERDDATPEEMDRNAMETFLVVLCPFAPYLAEELWRRMGHEGPLREAAWPVASDELVHPPEREFPILLEGKVRDRMLQPTNLEAEKLESRALGRERIRELIGTRKVAKVVVVPGRLINLVTRRSA